MTADDPDLQAQLIDHEGERLTVYDDATGKPLRPGDRIIGYPTIGVGRNLAGKGLTRAESRYLLLNDLRESIDDLKNLPGFAEASPIRQRVLVDMRLNLGPTRFRSFQRTLAAFAVGDYKATAAGMRNSRWWRQTGRRAKRLTIMMETNTDPGPQDAALSQGVSSMANGIAPNLRSIVERVAAQHPIDFRRCGRPDQEYPDNTFFSGLVVLEIYKDADKTGNQATIAESRRFGLNGKRGNPHDLSKDAISYQRVAGNLTNVDVIDIVNSSGTLNDDGSLTDEAEEKGEAPSTPTWNNQGNVNPGHWVDPDVLWEDGEPEPPEPPDPPHSGDGMVPYQPYPGHDESVFDQCGVAIEADYKRAGRPGLDSASVRWTARIMQDHLMGDGPPPSGHFLTLEESIAKHRREWCAELGIPVI